MKAPCCSDKSGLKKGPWTSEEDQKLTLYIQQHGPCRWRTLPKNAGLKRCGKSCRLRWINYLRPDIKRGRFSLEEEETIIQLHSVLGNKWSTIASHLPGRTDNEIKNYWNTHIRKKLLKMGIDPVTHAPRLDLLELSSLLSSALCNSSHNLNINLPNLLGLVNEPNFDLTNPNLLSLATTVLLSYQQPNKSSNDQFVNSQELQDYNHLFNHQNQVQNSIILQTCLENQLQNPILGHVQTSTGQLSQSLSNLDSSSYPNYLNNNGYLWENNREHANIIPNESFVPVQQENHTYNDYSKSIIKKSLSENQGLICNGIQNMSYSSVLSSTPNSYNSTPLNSSPTNYVNCSSTTTIEDEKDSFCNMLKYDMANIPTTINDVNQLL